MLALTAMPAVASAADVRSWDNLRTLAPDQKVSVLRTDAATVHREFAGCDDAVLRVRTRRGEIVLAVRTRSGTGKHVLIGAAAGAGGRSGGRCSGGRRWAIPAAGISTISKRAVTAACAGVGALGGALTGAWVGSRHERTGYDARRPGH